MTAGSPEEGGRDVTAAWGDSWHQQPGLLQLSGTIDDRALELAADYGGSAPER